MVSCIIGESALFLQTTEDKLGNLLRAYLMRCAEELPDSVHKLNLFLEFRSDKQIRTVIMRAKSILMADPGFFGVDSSNKRKKGTECHEQVAKLFVRNCLVPERDKMVTVPDAYGLFNEMLTKEGLEPLRKSLFRGLMSPLIKQEYDLSLRNDLIDANHRWYSGSI